ncbi:MAG: CBS domain-containing protein [Pseudomonadota bacterium]
MTVASILAQKGNAVITIGVFSKLSDVVDLLAENKIGAVVVTAPDGGIEGIVSERDVVRAMSQKGASALDDDTGEHMTHPVVHCSQTDTINVVMEKMTAGRFRHVPVVTDGRLSGLISIGDVVKERIQQAEKDAEEMRAYISAI